MPTLPQLLDFLHLANKGMLDIVRDKTYHPTPQDFKHLHDEVTSLRRGSP